MTLNVNTYTGLLTAIQQWTNRNDAVFIENIPLFISLAEQDFFYDCPLLGTQDYSTGTFNANNATVPKPALWGQTLTFSYIDGDNNVVIMTRVAYEYIRDLVPNKSNTPSSYLPQYYTDYGYNYFLVGPTPLQDFKFEIAYFKKAEPLSLSNQTNWITQYAYNVFFWCCLDKAFRFIDNIPEADAYYQKYQAGVQTLVGYDRDRKNDRSSDTLKG